MKKILKTLLLILLPFITILMTTKVVSAENITVDDVLTFMQSNNIFEDEEYFRLFGMILNGNDEYNITEFKYTIEKNASDFSVDVTLTDKDHGQINRSTIFTYTTDTISYTNPREKDTLESRIDTILLNQIIYSVGGARGYNKLALINWMNQVDLKNTISSDGIDSITEEVKYKYTKNNTNYTYILDVPTSYTIRINELIGTIPTSDYVKIKEEKKTISSITLSLYAEGHTDEECEIYRQNDGKYEKIATVSCNNGVFTDNNLKDDTKYTYQATIQNKIVCSDTKEVTTEAVPPTGAAAILVPLLILFVTTGAFFLRYRKYNVLKKV